MALLLLAQQGFTGGLRSFAVGHGVCQFLVKNHVDGRDRKSNFVLSEVCSALIVGGWMVLMCFRKSYLGPPEIM